MTPAFGTVNHNGGVNGRSNAVDGNTNSNCGLREGQCEEPKVAEDAEPGTPHSGSSVPSSANAFLQNQHRELQRECERQKKEAEKAGKSEKAERSESSKLGEKRNQNEKEERTVSRGLLTESVECFRLLMENFEYGERVAARPIGWREGVS